MPGGWKVTFFCTLQWCGAYIYVWLPSCMMVWDYAPREQISLPPGDRFQRPLSPHLRIFHRTSAGTLSAHLGRGTLSASSLCWLFRCRGWKWYGKGPSIMFPGDFVPRFIEYCICVCDVITFSKLGIKPGVVTNPAHGQSASLPNKENRIFSAISVRARELFGLAG